MLLHKNTVHRLTILLRVTAAALSLLMHPAILSFERLDRAAELTGGRSLPVSAVNQQNVWAKKKFILCEISYTT